MTPKLVVLDGPMKGGHFPLGAGAATIGRDSTNTVFVEDPCASRRHCRIAEDASGHLTIRDLDSRNGTFVNGVPVQERVLTHGDLIQAGNSTFLFLTTEEGARPGPRSVRLERGVFATLSAIRVPRAESVYLDPAKVLAAPALTGRLAQAFQAVLKVSAAIHTARGIDALAEELLRCLCEVVPASQGAVLLLEAGQPDPVRDFSYVPSSPHAETVPVPSDLVHRVFQEGIAVLANGAGFGEGAEVSVLAAPLFGAEGPAGVIYLAGEGGSGGFEEDHLQLVTMMGIIAGPAFENVQRLEWLEAENSRLREEIHIQHDMIGESAAMLQVYRFISKVAPSGCTVLVTGESGTGKELVARAIHRNSPRAQGPFVAVNCAALTETLIESELFGHERGAFTGAVAQKAGKLELAHGGTLFLDEIGELPLELQAKLLRFLQEREFERVGGTRMIRVDVRIIAATNRDLRAECAAAGRFRQDLYYRLNVVALTMPALRERPEDIVLLASYFASRFGRQSGRRVVGISREARKCLAEYRWPGNVRELENVIERAVVLGSGDLILPEDLPDDVIEKSAAGGGTSYYTAVQSGKKQLVLKALQQARGNYTEAARILGMHANSLHRLIRKLDLKEEIRELLSE